MSLQLFSRLFSGCCSFWGGARLLKSWGLGRHTLAEHSIVTFSKVAFGISVVVLLASGAASPAFAGEAAGDELSTAQVFRKVEEKYASLASYSDEGCVVIAPMEGDSIVTFNTRVARPTYYRIEWRRGSEATSFPWGASPEAAWSSSVYNLLSVKGCRVQREYNRDTALAHAAGPSGGAAETIPQRFFNWRWGDRGEKFDDVVLSEKRQADEKVGNISCYVFTRGSEGRTNTLWIGKQDFLIHQVRTTISTGAIQATAAGLLRNPDPERIRALHGFTATETHTNIVLNQKYSRSDFVPSFPLFGSPCDE